MEGSFFLAFAQRSRPLEQSLACKSLLSALQKGLKKLLDGIIDGGVGRLVITHKDRLLRFGSELVFAVCEAKNVEVFILKFVQPHK